MESNSSEKSRNSGNKPRVNNSNICQNCGHHNNKPSYCRKKGTWTPRKDTCEDFKRSKK